MSHDAEAVVSSKAIIQTRLTTTKNTAAANGTYADRANTSAASRKNIVPGTKNSKFPAATAAAQAALSAMQASQGALMKLDSRVNSTSPPRTRIAPSTTNQV